MNGIYEAKVRELAAEFTRYLVEHPELGDMIPADAQVVLLDRSDPAYSELAIRNAQQAKVTDDVSARPLVYAEVQEMAPVRSRVRKLAIHEEPPTYVTA